MIAVRAVIAVLIVCCATPARADDRSAVQARIAAALKASKSFVATSQLKLIPYSSTTVFVAPDRTKTIAVVHDPATGKADTTETITIGTALYVSKNNAPFVKATLTSDQLDAIASITNVEIATLVPDVIAGGKTFGSYTTVVGSGSKAVTLTCTYDKGTYRIATCANPQLSQTFSAYDDPSNTIEAPKELH